MNTVIINVKPFDPTKKFELGNYSSPFSSARDVKAAIDKTMEIKSQQSVLVPTNLCVEIPNRYFKKETKISSVFGELPEIRNIDTGFQLELQVRAKSGISLKKQLIITNGFGTIDADYRGEIKVSLTNVGPNSTFIEPGEEIAQLALAPVLKYDWNVVAALSDTLRNDRGFGGMTEQNKNDDKSFYEVDMTVYYICTRYGYCLKCGKHELKLKDAPSELTSDVVHKQCDFCGQTFQFSLTTYPTYVISVKHRAVSSMPFSPIYPTEEDITKIINEDEKFKPTENEIFFLRNPHITI